jgi:3-deoxy-D-manno-octulosonic acid (KDO) 8-phosphate synthase
MSKLYTDLANSQNFFLIAGPCVIEEERIMYSIAETLKELLKHPIKKQIAVL